MPNNGDNHGTAIVKSIKGLDVATEILRRTRSGSTTGGPVDAVSLPVPTEVRSVRRGKFFLSKQQQLMHGSFRRPLFQYWGHGVVVGEMTPVDEPEGFWCYGAHNDFDLVPEFTRPSEWPEYTRTETGWVRKDGNRRISEGGTFSNAAPDAHLKTMSLDDLLKLTSTLKRLK